MEKQIYMMTNMHVYWLNVSNVTAAIAFFPCLQITDRGSFNFVVDENTTQKCIAAIPSSCRNGVFVRSFF